MLVFIILYFTSPPLFVVLPRLQTHIFLMNTRKRAKAVNAALLPGLALQSPKELKGKGGSGKKGGAAGPKEAPQFTEEEVAALKALGPGLLLKTGWGDTLLSNEDDEEDVIGPELGATSASKKRGKTQGKGKTKLKKGEEEADVDPPSRAKSDPKKKEGKKDITLDDDEEGANMPAPRKTISSKRGKKGSEEGDRVDSEALLSKISASIGTKGCLGQAEDTESSDDEPLVKGPSAGHPTTGLSHLLNQDEPSDSQDEEMNPLALDRVAQYDEFLRWQEAQKSQWKEAKSKEAKGSKDRKHANRSSKRGDVLKYDDSSDSYDSIDSSDVVSSSRKNRRLIPHEAEVMGDNYRPPSYAEILALSPSHMEEKLKGDHSLTSFTPLEGRAQGENKKEGRKKSKRRKRDRDRKKEERRLRREEEEREEEREKKRKARKRQRKGRRRNRSRRSSREVDTSSSSDDTSSSSLSSADEDDGSRYESGEEEKRKKRRAKKKTRKERRQSRSRRLSQEVDTSSSSSDEDEGSRYESNRAGARQENRKEPNHFTPFEAHFMKSNERRVELSTALLQAQKEQNQLTAEKTLDKSSLTSESKFAIAFRCMMQGLTLQPKGGLGYESASGLAKHAALTFSDHHRNFQTHGIHWRMTPALIELVCSGKLTVVGLGEFTPWTSEEALTAADDSQDPMRLPLAKQTRKALPQETFATWDQVSRCVKNFIKWISLLFGRSTVRGFELLHDFMEAHCVQSLSVKPVDVLSLWYTCMKEIEHKASRNLEEVSQHGEEIGQRVTGTPQAIATAFLRISTSQVIRDGKKEMFLKPLMSVLVEGEHGGGVLRRWVERRNERLAAFNAQVSSGRLIPVGAVPKDDEAAKTKPKEKGEKGRKKTSSKKNASPTKNTASVSFVGSEDEVSKLVTKEVYNRESARVRKATKSAAPICYRHCSNEGCSYDDCSFAHLDLTKAQVNQVKGSLDILTSRYGGRRGQPPLSAAALEV